MERFVEEVYKYIKIVDKWLPKELKGELYNHLSILEQTKIIIPDYKSQYSLQEIKALNEVFDEYNVVKEHINAILEFVRDRQYHIHLFHDYSATYNQDVALIRERIENYAGDIQREITFIPDFVVEPEKELIHYLLETERLNDFTLKVVLTIIHDVKSVDKKLLAKLANKNIDRLLNIEFIKTTDTFAARLTEAITNNLYSFHLRPISPFMDTEELIKYLDVKETVKKTGKETVKKKAPADIFAGISCLLVYYTGNTIYYDSMPLIDEEFILKNKIGAEIVVDNDMIRKYENIKPIATKKEYSVKVEQINPSEKMRVFINYGDLWCDIGEVENVDFVERSRKYNDICENLILERAFSEKAQRVIDFYENKVKTSSFDIRTRLQNTILKWFKESLMVMTHKELTDNLYYVLNSKKLYDVLLSTFDDKSINALDVASKIIKFESLVSLFNKSLERCWNSSVSKIDMGSLSVMTTNDIITHLMAAFKECLDKVLLEMDNYDIWADFDISLISIEQQIV